MTARAAWNCPECGAVLVAISTAQELARNALHLQVREHLDAIHAATADLTNAAAQAGGWLSAAGHQVTLWGGPEDGAELSLPPGPLPASMGVMRGTDGRLYPVRSDLGQQVLTQHLAVYRHDGDRYTYTERAQ